MDIQKEREAFEDCYKTSRDYKFYVKHEMSEKQIFEFKNDKYVVDCVNDGWKIWQAAKAQAVPEGFVLVPKEPTDIEIESIKEKHWDMRGCQLCKSDYIDLYKAMIEAQEPTND